MIDNKKITAWTTRNNNTPYHCFAQIFGQIFAQTLMKTTSLARQFIVCCTMLVLSLNVSEMFAATIVSSDSVGSNTLRVWLTVEVLERKASLGNSASALNEYIPVVIMDSASNASLYALSGEMVELGADRTYFISVVSGDDKRFTIQGAPVQVIRTESPTQKDLVYQREFLIRETLPPDTTLHLPERIVSDAQPMRKPSLKPEAATISYNADKLPECPYIVQFCALSLEKDAMQIREALRSAAVSDARVEPFKDIARGIQYYRVRAGCFFELGKAKSAQDSFFKTSQRLKLGVVPIVVKQ